MTGTGGQDERDGQQGQEKSRVRCHTSGVYDRGDLDGPGGPPHPGDHGLR
ncbi:hypothetical protein DVS28_a0246 [Euzebya pacifica]|uniref:Uncharacterized protein n=1 Tax=Euzebya pacifica TaxID=1608957 RepID=A0A346XRV6_9ACTN|nr:hypothetical protein DVS28_a0246 [Euzebya pacifica]